MADWAQLDQRERLHRETQINRSSEAQKNRDTRVTVTDNNNRTRRDISERKNKSDYDIAVVKGEVSLEAMDKALEQEYDYKDLRVTELLETENIKLQSLDAELEIRGDAAGRQAVMLATVDIAQRKDDSAKLSQEGQIERDRMRLEADLLMERDTHQHKLSGGISDNSGVLTAEQLEAASKNIRQNRGLVSKDELKNDFITEGIPRKPKPKP